MTPKERVADMKAWGIKANYITPAQLAGYLGRGREYVYNLLHGLEYLQSGNKKCKMYLLKDVAERLDDYRRIS